MGKKKERTSKKRARKSTSVFKQHRRSVVLICFVLVFLSLVLGVSSITLRSRNENYKQQEAELEAQIKEQEERAEEIEEFEEYVQTDEYIKDVAEEKLGLVDPDEILFKPSN
ncbi:MAG: septum formation initiator family protein [Ruminococcus sp.]|nr:septum formation initiator family protein [Ruminococcus sp.]